MALVWLLLVFAGTFLVVLVTVFFLRVVSARIEGVEAPLPFEEGPALLQGDQLSTISPWARLLERFDFIEGLKRRIQQAGLGWSVGRVTLLMLLCGALAMALLGGFEWMPFWGRTLGAGFAASLPYQYISRKRDKRLLAIEEQFPEAMDSLARALRAGYPFAPAVESVAAQSPAPLAGELRRIWAEASLGKPWDQALENLALRLPLQEVSLFCSAVQLHSRSGGNLSEILDKLSGNMREAAAIRGEVRSLSAQGRMAGRVLSILPVFIAMVMMFVNPRFLDPLFHTETGRYLLTAAGVSLLTAHLVIRKLVDIRL